MSVILSDSVFHNGHRLGRRLVAALSLAVLFLPPLAGCGDGQRNRIVGVWHMQTAEQLQDLAARAVGDNDLADLIRSTGRLAQRVGGADPSGGRMTLEFRHNGTLVTTTRFPMAGSEKTGTWRWLGMASDGKTGRVRCTLGGETVETEIVFLDEETIRLVPPNLDAIGVPLVFRRER